MRIGLIGHTGFVGSHLIQPFQCNFLYNSKNISEIRKRSFDLLLISGAPAEKWRANQNPDADLKNINSLIENLKTVEAERAVLISTVDVFGHPIDVTENSEPKKEGLHPYGLHRLHLEEFVTENFRSSHIIRLPGLFGRGLKKNVIFDFMNKNNLEKIDSRGSFQFYNLGLLAQDIRRVLQLNLKLTHFSTEPVTVESIGKFAFGINFKNEINSSPAKYDFKTVHQKLWAEHLPGYLYSKENVLNEIKLFVENEREKSE